MTHAGGRPTLYTDQIVPQSEEYLKTATPENMEIATVEGLAIYLGVRRSTLYEWAKTYAEFSDTLDKLQEIQKHQLIKTGIFGGKEINANIISLMLKANHGMKETTVNEVGGVINADGTREPFQLFVNAGQGFLPTTLTLSSSPAGGITKQPAEIQSINMASESSKNLHSNNGNIEAGAS